MLVVVYGYDAIREYFKSAVYRRFRMLEPVSGSLSSMSITIKKHT